MLKKLLMAIVMAGTLLAQPLSNYNIVQFDQGSSIPGYCTLPGFYWFTNTSRLYTCNASHQFVVDQPTATSLFAQTASVTVANTTTETSVVGSGQGSVTLSANFLTPGTTIRLHAWGYHSAVASPNITVNFKLGGTTVLTTGAVATNNSTNQLIDIQVWLTCRTSGASGVLSIEGGYDEWTSSGTNRFPMINTSTTTLDTTKSQTVDVTVTWSAAAAGDTFTLTNLNLDQVR